MKINEKIYSLRKKNNLSQEELADKLNVTRQTISKWELGESVPDLDKVVPLCNLFGITPDELLMDKKKNSSVVEEDKPDKIKALLISISVFLYFLSIVSIIISEEYLHLNEGVMISIFFIIIGIATSLIVFTCMTRPSKKEKEEDIKDPKLKSIISIVSLITTIIYLLVSFYTMAWHITWIIWIIYSVIVKIIELIYGLKVNNNE